MRSVGTLLRPACVSLVAAAVLAWTAPGALASHSTLSAERRFDELLQLPQWREVTRRLPQEAELVRACIKGRCASAAAQRMALMVRESAAPDRLSQIRRVHEAVNREPYREDADQFGLEDKWQSPMAFALRGGDCEDFAIAKYFVLRLLGMPASDLRIAVLTGLGGGEIHAVLLARVHGEWQVLDNREEKLRSVASYGNWIVRYAVTEAAGFRYQPAPSSKPPAPAQR